MIWLSIRDALSSTIRGKSDPLEDIEILDTNEKKDNSLLVLIAVLVLATVGTAVLLKENK